MDCVGQFGSPSGDTAVVGDWTGDGTRKIGVFRDPGNGLGYWVLRPDLNDHYLGNGCELWYRKRQACHR